MKRTELARKSKAKRTYKTERCTIRGCNKGQIVDGLCNSHARDQADRWCRALALQAHPQCTRCGSSANLQWSHHLSRRFMEIRYSPSNYTIHCAGCHKWLTENPAAHTELIVDMVGPANYELLMDAAYGPMDEFSGRRTGPPKFTHQDMADWYMSLRKAAA